MEEQTGAPRSFEGEAHLLARQVEEGGLEEYPFAVCAHSGPAWLRRLPRLDFRGGGSDPLQVIVQRLQQPHLERDGITGSRCVAQDR